MNVPNGAAQPPAAPSTPDTGPTFYAFCIVIAAIAAAVGITMYLVYHYPSRDSKAVEGILGLVLSAITTLAGAAFGFSTGSKAGASAGAALAQNSNAAERRTKDAARQAADTLRRARSDHTPPLKAAAQAQQPAAPGQVDNLENALMDAESALRAVSG